MQTTSDPRNDDPRKEDMGKHIEQHDREKVEHAEEYERSDGSTSLGLEQDHQESSDIIPAQQEEEKRTGGAGYEEFIQDAANRSADDDTVERESLAGDRGGQVEREQPIEGNDVEREGIAGEDYRGIENPT